MVTGDFSIFTGVNLIVGAGAELQLGSWPGQLWRGNNVQYPGHDRGNVLVWARMR